MIMIKALIIEDESLIARQLQSKINSVADDIQILEILPSLKTAKRWLLNNAEPDLEIGFASESPPPYNTRY